MIKKTILSDVFSSYSLKRKKKTISNEILSYLYIGCPKVDWQFLKFSNLKIVKGIFKNFKNGFCKMSKVFHCGSRFLFKIVAKDDALSN